MLRKPFKIDLGTDFLYFGKALERCSDYPIASKIIDILI
jgi:hypothetical protein